MSTNIHTGDHFPIKTVGQTYSPGLFHSGGGAWSTLGLNLKENPEFQEVQRRVAAIEERLAILNPDETLQAKYPALQEAYDHYKLIEKLVKDHNNGS